MKKILILLFIVACNFTSYSQEKEQSDVFTSEKYIQLRDYYIESINSVEVKESQTATKEFIDKIGKENIAEIKKANSIAEWLKENWQSISFTSSEEAHEVLEKYLKSEEKSRILTKKMTPLFTELKNEVGYSALFKKLSEDYNKSVLN